MRNTEVAHVTDGKSLKRQHKGERDAGVVTSRGDKQDHY